MDNTEPRYFPFNAINEFMLPEFRQRVISEVLRQVDKLRPEQKAAINSILRSNLSVPGFRNSAAAPLGMRARGAVAPFERFPEFAAVVLQAWCDLHPELRQQVYQALQGRSFGELLPELDDRSLLPGFQVEWPLDETYEALDEAFFEANPEHKDTNTDDIRLMVVWLVNRLPYDLFADED